MFSHSGDFWSVDKLVKLLIVLVILFILSVYWPYSPCNIFFLGEKKKKQPSKLVRSRDLVKIVNGIEITIQAPLFDISCNYLNN